MDSTVNEAEPLLTQVQIEERMYGAGITRATEMFAKAEATGNAARSPYASAILREHVLPLAEAIDAARATQNARLGYLALLEGQDSKTVAYLAVRTALNALLEGKDLNHRQIAYGIGKAVHQELILAGIERVAPELYHTLVTDFGRRLSKSERHRMTVFKMQAKKAKIEVIEWPAGARDQVGIYLLGLLEVVGLVQISESRLVAKAGRRPQHAPREVWLAPAVMDQIDEFKAHMAVNMPLYGPCVEPPRPWTTPFDGGFHTRELQRTTRSLVHATSAAREIVRAHDMPIVLEAVNALQNTAWQVNSRVLDIVRETAKFSHSKEIVSLTEVPKPERPAWLDKGMDQKLLTEAQREEFKRWKRQMAEWYTQRKLLGTRYGRFYSATRSAEMFRAYTSIYFVYFADSRGRLYPMTYGLNPQGSDLQRGLLRFSAGLPLDTPESIRWFHVQGANKWGFDKATLEQRQQWVVDRQDLILAMASDPLSNRDWLEADSPVQFLAWCLEYHDWFHDTSGSFVSRLPISMDGSCNGLQNLSALLRDEVGGYATNLVPTAEMQDIYRQVAAAATSRLANLEHSDLQRRWLAHGIERAAVKRAVMTTPYGVTRSSAEEYIRTDYLDEGKAPVFEKFEYRAASRVLIQALWPAIGDVVVKGREAMSWLTKSARVIIKASKEETPVIHWVTPSGFPATQAYWEEEVHRIRTHLHGEVKVRVHSESNDPDVFRHANGLAPNFVHSMDAAHLHLTTAAAYRLGIDALAMIHDDYGTHAANAQKLYEVIREQFVGMYEHFDPIGDFKEKYPMIPEPPQPGTLDIRGVLESKYFFS